MASLLPSYHEATARADWLRLVAPYVAPRDYTSLCLVDRRCWDIFAPRLWRDVLKTVRLAGLQSGDDLAWWFEFVFAKLDRLRPQTRALVKVLDTREFAKDSYHFSIDQQERTVQQSFRKAFELLPNLTCILLDGHEDVDAGSFLIGSTDHAAYQRPLLLSIADCPTQLPATFFNSSSLQGLVYLDISSIPGSIWSLIQPALLPYLRILKIRNREVDDATLTALVGLLRLRLWSLDLSDNRATDAVIDTVRDKCFPVTELRSPAHFSVEGSLVATGKGALGYGPFVFIEESEWSGSMNHPERYLVDAPVYVAEPDAGPQEYQTSRSNGRSPIRRDLAEPVVRHLSGEGHETSAESYRTSSGITHLALSNNRISAFGIQKLLRISNGQIENFACDSMPLVGPSQTSTRLWPKTARLYGILGAAHTLRPVISSNLQTLRIHHSVVTQIPTLELDGLSTLARLYLAETAILSRSELAYPQAFVPDMNPRLKSLTLTRLPRRSAGPLILKLINFLKQLSAQERAVQDASPAITSWRGPSTLEGLRHVRLEFEPDPMEEGFSAAEGLDAQELMNAGDQGFSFFDDERRRPSPGSLPVSESAQAANPNRDTYDDESPESGRENSDDFVMHHGEWDGKVFSIPVWAGPKLPGKNPVVDDYRRLVLEHGLREHVGPASPAQVRAGAPEKSHVFHTAWCVAVMPKQLPTPPWSELSKMKDVLEELKRYRLVGRAKYAELQGRCGKSKTRLGEPHHFWTGKLEVSKEEPMPHARPSQYWR